MAITSLIALVLSIKKKEALWYVIALLLGAGIGLGVGFLPTLEGKGSVVGIVTKTSENYFIIWSIRGRYYVTAQDHAYEVGDWVQVSGTFKAFVRTTYESRFDFGQYLNYLGVRKEIAYPKIAGRFLLPLRFRTYEKAFLANFSSDSQGVLSALLFNRKDYSSSAVSLASSLNVLFLLSASGMFFAFVFRTIRRWLDRHIEKERTTDLIVLIIESLFLPLALHKIGLARIILKDGFSLANKHFLKERWTRLEVVSISGIILIGLWPFAVFQTGFLLGYGLSFFMFFESSYIRGVKGALRRKILGLLLIRLFILPVAVSSSGEFHIFGLFITELCLPYALLLFVLGWLGYLIVPIPMMMNPLCEGFVKFLGFLTNIDPVINLPMPGAMGILLFFLCYLFILFLSELKWRRFRNKSLLLFLSCYLFSLAPIAIPFSQEVCFINVGQGDCIFLRDRWATAMIDTGGNLSFDMAKEVIIPFLRKKRVYHLDYLIITHHDFDHYGAAESLRASFDVRHYVEEGDAFPLSVGNMTLTNLNVYGGNEENDLSLVIYTEFMGKKWLFTGDAPKEIENKILQDEPDLDCDILKVGHHGSDTSTSEEFVARITPSEAVISVGAKNSYGHPTQIVLAVLQKYGVKVRRTDIEGTITYARACYPWV